MTTFAKIELRNVSKIFGSLGNHPINEITETSFSKEEILNRYQLNRSLCHINLRIKSGELFVVMGLSGSGKSTLIRTINRLVEVSEGSVWVDGQNVTLMSEPELLKLRKFKVSMVFQKFGLFPHWSVEDNISFGAYLQGKSKKECRELAHLWINKMGLLGYEKSLPKQLSGGMQQRVGLARALATDADVLLMDEPLSALDPILRPEIQDLILKLHSDLKRTIVFITHDIDEALKLGEQIAIMRDGEIQQVGTPQDIIQSPANEYVERFVVKS